MIDQLDQVLGELTRLHADADRLIDQYIELIRERDELYNIPIPVIRQTQIENRAGVCMDARYALQLIRADLEAGKLPSVAVSVPQQLAFDPDTTLVTDDLTPSAAARLLKRQRGKPVAKSS
jgi:hypothetical protein